MEELHERQTGTEKGLIHTRYIISTWLVYLSRLFPSLSDAKSIKLLSFRDQTRKSRGNMVGRNMKNAYPVVVFRFFRICQAVNSLLRRKIDANNIYGCNTRKINAILSDIEKKKEYLQRYFMLR